MTTTILDEKEPAVSLKLIVLIVSLVTFGLFGTMFFVNGSATGNDHKAQSASQQTL
jgi:hypothetical protein